MTKEAATQEPYERRALLLHLGDVLETVFCLSQCADDYASIGDAVRGNDALASFTLLGFVDQRMTPRDFIRRASGAFFIWPKALLDASLNRPMLASTVKSDLFDDNAAGWRAYVDERRAEVGWFGEDVPEVAQSAAPAHPAVAEPESEPVPARETKKESVAPTKPVEASTRKEVSAKKEPSRYATWPWPNKK
ncbi:hypothetical protein [Caballeronia sp. LZ016]|uniref:hypothetical protein n=1 Tax=Caballeronia sp. LZ016 TaxID=3038554 RepID=UPI002861638F|nr:hypothetical protein [Caballeronia sp. LZ016]MDR5739431.1 hypothetical protein [Caballeronia sp. LZ016]